MQDQLFLDTWEAHVKEIIDGGKEAVIEPTTPSLCPSVVSVGLLGHTSIEAESRFFEWVEKFIDDYRAYWEIEK
jgi:hypothetical protein